MTVEVNADQFAETMHKYAEVYSTRHPEKGLGQVIRERALNLAIKLYQATKAAAPTQATIAADVQKQGWRIPTTFPDGRLGRGTPDQWVGGSLNALPKHRGRKSKARLAQEESIRTSKPTLQDMQAFVIRHRSAHIGFVASGWNGARHDLGDASASGRYGHAETMEDGAEVDITNNAPGSTEAEAREHFVAKGVAAATQDMAQHIAQILKEQREAS